MSTIDYQTQLESKGWLVINNAVPINLIKQMNDDIEAAEKICQKIQEKNGISEITQGTVHHLPVLFQSFVDVLEYYAPFDELLTWYFSGKYILNSLGGNLNIENRYSYANNIHRDIRSYSQDENFIINTLVMLDDFTIENGATLLLSRSHYNYPNQPSEEEFYAAAEPALGTAGSILIFNSNVWHAAGKNLTKSPRRSITPMLSKPFFKQQFDYCRGIGYEKVANYSEFMKQILGYNARIPATLDEWYQPPEKRMYKKDQG